MMTATTHVSTRDHARPVAYVAMADRAARAQILEVLEQAGWAVIPQSTGFHLLQAIADVIEGQEPWLQPDLIVVDVYARGCAGTTIATGLRELGVDIAIVLVGAPAQALPLSSDATLRIVDGASASRVVAELVSRTAPHEDSDPPTPAAWPAGTHRMSRVR